VEWSEPLLAGRHAGSAEGARLAHLSKAASFERAAVAEQIARETSVAYWQLYLSQREVEIRAANEAVAREQLRVMEAEIARGARSKLAAAEVEDELARRREELLVARRVLIERSLDLAFVIGEPANEELRAGDAPNRPTAIGLESALELVRVHSPRLGAADETIEAASAQAERVDDEQRSRVDVALQGAAWASESELAVAAHRAAGTGGWSIELAITWRQPLSREAQRGATAAARARETAARLAKSDVERELADAVVRAVRRQQNAAQRRIALERAIELAMTNLDAERKRWERGDTTTYEVLRRQSALADVQIRAERARVDELLAGSELEALTGAPRTPS
jgi:outer membrane protein TolC